MIKGTIQQVVIYFRWRYRILLQIDEGIRRSSFQFEYIHPAVHMVQLAGIGWDRVATPDYRLDGRKTGGEAKAIFQVTLSGQGEFCWKDTTYPVPPLTAFLCTKPSSYIYSFPEGGDHWEFLYISLRGLDAMNHWTELIEHFGPVIDFRNDATAIQLLFDLYRDIYNNPKLDKYEISMRIYAVLLELHRYRESRGAIDAHPPEYIFAVYKYVEQRYSSLITLEDLAAQAKLSKYHFCRQFIKCTGLTPVQYVNKIRVEKAAWLLRHTGRTVDTISSECGFQTRNYFNLVFRNFVGISPSDYRKGKTVHPAHFLRIEK
jgi:AraC-like DNA-binding protein